MDITKFQLVNETRAKRWHNGDLSQWSLLEWTGAMCGESGEASNFAKKIKRLDIKLPNLEKGIPSKNRVELEFKCAQEVADSIIYGLIILSQLGFDASMIIGNVFDQKSIEYGFPERAPR